jgi:hypothetical protein
VTPPVNGTAIPNGDGRVTYTPAAGFTGVDTFKYTVADSQGAVSNQATVTVTINAVSAEVVIDNGGPGTSYTGTWDVSSATGSYGSKSVWSRDGTKYRWTFVPAVTGNYQVSMWWTVYSSRSTAVPVDIMHSGGTARVTINQKLNGGKWNGLGVYSLIAGTSYTVTVTSQPYPSSTCADAVKFAYLTDTAEYVAVGDSITEGTGDDISSDGIGYEPILGNLLTASSGSTVEVANEGIGGVAPAGPERPGAGSRGYGIFGILQGQYAADPFRHLRGGEDAVPCESSLYHAGPLRHSEHPGIQRGDR